MEKSNWTKDWQYGAALVAAPIVWGGLYVINQPQIHVGWVLASPMLFLMLVMIRPILEEIVFRGLLQGYVIKQAWAKARFAGMSIANLITSLLFAALHFISHPPLMAFAVFVPSLIFGYFRDRYDAWLIPSIALHCIYNVGYFLIFYPV